jgi:hypothetical protein
VKLNWHFIKRLEFNGGIDTINPELYEFFGLLWLFFFQLQVISFLGANQFMITILFRKQLAVFFHLFQVCVGWF